MAKLTEEQVEYIYAHPVDKPSVLAKHIGCKIASVVWYRKKKSREKVVAERKRKREQRVKEIIRLYPEHPSTYIAKKFGMARQSVNEIAKRYGVSHSEECIRRIRENAAKRLRSKEVGEKKGKTYKRVFLLEKTRFYSGLSQKTKLRVTSIPNKVTCARRFLVSRYGYVYDATIKQYYTLFYHDGTDRLTQAEEERYTKKYHFRFEEIPKESHGQEGGD